jgi:hypothetical protein
MYRSKGIRSMSMGVFNEGCGVDFSPKKAFGVGGPVSENESIIVIRA